DGEAISALMTSLENEKKYQISKKIRTGLGNFYGGFADQEETKETIGRMYRENGYLIDTHTAVGYKVYEDYKKETGDTTPTIIASTASAYKFAESVSKALDIPEECDGFAYIHALNTKTNIPIPTGLRNLESKRVLHKEVLEKNELLKLIRELL
ncbi:MAG: threonine synthase, partial [Eubacteriales bacterium]|nr:threonine synthase [Eubacteriales bacterium]